MRPVRHRYISSRPLGEDAHYLAQVIFPSEWNLRTFELGFSLYQPSSEHCCVLWRGCGRHQAPREYDRIQCTLFLARGAWRDLVRTYVSDVDSHVSELTWNFDAIDKEGHYAFGSRTIRQERLRKNAWRHRDGSTTSTAVCLDHEALIATNTMF